jgi:hypothetical protein
MSVVSKQLGIINIGRTRHVPCAVQYEKNDSGEAEPSDFTQPPQLPTFNLSKKIRRPNIDMMPKFDGEYVPFKSAQQNSHAMGAALFDAPTPVATAQLDSAPLGRKVNYDVGSDELRGMMNRY